MTSDNQTIDLVLEINDPDADDAQRDRATRQLRDELRHLDVESVELVSAESIPDDAKVVGAAEIGALAVKVIPTVLPKLVGLVRDWAGRKSGRAVAFKATVAGNTIDLTFTPESMTTEELEQMVNRFIASLNVKPAAAP